MNNILMREEWLNIMAGRICAMFHRLGIKSASNYHVSCGFPSSGARGNTIGECFYRESSEGDFVEIFIHPSASHDMEVAEILAHELIHASLGKGFGHRKEFRAIMKKINLVGKPTSTEPGPKSIEQATQWIKEIGPYPHATLTGSCVKKQPHDPQINLRCADRDCDYVMKVVYSDFRRARPRGCPACGLDMLTKEERGL